MGLFDIFRNREDKPAASSAASATANLPNICYGIAYFILPHYAFKDCDKIIKVWTETPESAGAYFYFMGCAAQKVKVEPVREHAAGFRVHHGQLNDALDYFVLEYPTPPPFQMPKVNPEPLAAGQLPVLAPHFSAIVRHRQTQAVSFYTLGQSPSGGGTTFRSVTPDGVNCNLGPGPEPRLEAFLARLRSDE